MIAKAMPHHVVLGLFLTAAALPAPAAASEWGCEVLLCASSSNPSWRGVPACHPPMNRLISAMKKPGFDWPTCPEAGTGRQVTSDMRIARRATRSEAGGTAMGSPERATCASRQSTFARAKRTVSTVLIGSGAAYKRSPYPDRLGQSHITSTSRMTPLVKPSGIGSSSTDKRFFSVKEGLIHAYG